MRLKISNRSGAFFDLFVESAENLRAAALELKDMVDRFQDVEMKARRLEEREHQGDQVTREIIRLLNTSFITPMDREDIYTLATALDDVMDAIEAAAELMVLHAIVAPLPQMKAQADVLVQATGQTEEALRRLNRFRREELEPYWVEINRLENEGDKLYRRAVADLFSGDHRAMDVLKWKEIIETLEEALDGLENVANVVEAVTLKNA